MLPWQQQIVTMLINLPTGCLPPLYTIAMATINKEPRATVSYQHKRISYIGTVITRVCNVAMAMVVVGDVCVYKVPWSLFTTVSKLYD